METGNEKSKMNLDTFTDFKVKGMDEEAVARLSSDENVMFDGLSKEQLYDLAEKKHLEANIQMSKEELIYLLRVTGGL
jgi:hypothetical protein